MNNDVEAKAPTTWPGLAESLYSFLTGRGAAIEYTFDHMDIHVPASTANDATRAKWTLNGSLRVRTSEQR